SLLSYGRLLVSPTHPLTQSIMAPPPTVTGGKKSPTSPTTDSTQANSPDVDAMKPDIGTLDDNKNEDYTGPPKKVEKKLRRRSKKSRKLRKAKSKEGRRRSQEKKNMRNLKTKHRDNDIVAGSAPGTVPNESKGDTVDEGSEDFLNGLLEGNSSAAVPEYDDEDLSEAPVMVRIVKAISNLVAYLMNHPMVPIAFGVAILIILSRKVV
ncbi:hypothetical protein PFISCL1PPCAC_10949, partial [Pristionchus fissidentatus]